MRSLNLQSVKDLLDAIRDIRKKQPRRRASRADGYNVFRILGVEEKEVSMHSAFLAHLFNPRGTHGQRTLFLDYFLTEVETARQASDWTCDKEWIISNGRIDILLQSKQDGVIIAIENKIRASDEATQLRRYRDWLDRPYRQQRFPRRRLLFLTLKGERSKQPDAEDVDYECISYREDVVRFLQKAQRKIAAVEVKNTIEQYVDTLKLLMEESPMGDPVDREIVETLLRPKYRDAALAIARCGPSIVDALLCDFWGKGKEELQQRLNTSGYSFWALIESENGPNQSGYYLALVPRLAHQRPRVMIRFYQHRTEKLFRLERCVQFAGLDAEQSIKRKVSRLPEVKALQGQLEATEMPQWYVWDAYQRITRDSKGIHMILEEEAADQRYSTALFEDSWEWFVNLEEQFRKLDKAVAALLA
jgi:hypothetical protein